MKFSRWRKSKLTVQKETVKVANACPCGCSKYPFIYIFDGKVGMTVEFQTKKELDEFKEQVNDLEMGKTQ